MYELEVLQSHDQTSDVHQENIILKKLNKEVLSKMYALDSKLKELIEQNRQLWQEVYKKEKRQEYFNNIIKPCQPIDLDQGLNDKALKREIPEKSTSYDPNRQTIKDFQKKDSAINLGYPRPESANEAVKQPLVSLGGFIPSKKVQQLPASQDKNASHPHNIQPITPESEKEFEEKSYEEMSQEMTYFHDESYPEFESPEKENMNYPMKFKEDEFKGNNGQNLEIIAAGEGEGENNSLKSRNRREEC